MEHNKRTPRKQNEGSTRTYRKTSSSGQKSGGKTSSRSSKSSSRRARPARNVKKTAHIKKRNPKNGTPDWIKNLPKLEDDAIRVIPLGGVEEIGRNMTAVEYKDEIVVIDAGIGFQDEDTPGIDYMIPNIKYLQEFKDKIKALVITHGHLDHIGGIPYILNAIGNPPIYTREFGALLIKAKCSEFPQVKPNIIVAEEHDGALPISDNLKVRFFGLTHSIPDSTGIILETPYGDIVSTGDVRVDNIDGEPIAKEYEQYKFFKDRNVLLMTMDSTGIPFPGWSASESQVVENIDEIIKNAPGRLIIGTFASQVERIIEFVNSAKKYGKYVVVEGRSMKTNVGIAEQLSLTDFSHVIPVEEIDDYPPHKIVMLATGAQGEEFAALMRMSNNTHKYISLTRSDTVVLSASVIPGNETAVDRLKDNLYRNNARVITYMDNIVHASGHGKRGELEWLHKQIDYKYFMPVHGHHHRLKMHSELAQELGCPADNIVVPDNGTVVEIRKKGTELVRTKHKVPGDPLIVDGFSISDSQHLVLRDRKMLAQDGIFTIVVMLDTKSKKLRKSPDLISRGFVVLKENQDLLKQTRKIIKDTIETGVHGMNPIDFDFIKDAVSKKVAKYLLQQTGKRPVVIPVILGV